LKKLQAKNFKRDVPRPLSVHIHKVTDLELKSPVEESSLNNTLAYHYKSEESRNLKPAVKSKDAEEK
jgi:hypothetical protein